MHVRLSIQSVRLMRTDWKQQKTGNAASFWKPAPPVFCCLKSCSMIPDG